MPMIVRVCRLEVRGDVEVYVITIITLRIIELPWFPIYSVRLAIVGGMIKANGDDRILKDRQPS